MARAASIPLRPLLIPIAARRLRRAAADAAGIEDLVALSFEFDAFGIRLLPGQVKSEIAGLLKLLQPRRCKRILEIGTQNGGSLFLLSQVAAQDALLISVDLPQGEFGGGYPPWRARLYKAFGQRGQRIELIRADSHSERTLERVRERLGDERLDFLFVDGDHRYEGVRRDFELYAPLVAPDGLIAFHDVAPGPAKGSVDPVIIESSLLGGEVPQFWQEIKPRYRTTELAASQHGFYGIGVIHLESAA